MGVRSGRTPTTVREPAKPEPHPRQVITPLNPACTEALLRTYNILPQWQHIIDGLRHGFDVGILENPSHTYIF